MEKTRHSGQAALAGLAAVAAELPVPTRYFEGVRRSEFPVPDNILFFARRTAAELHDGALRPHLHERWVWTLCLRGAGTVRVDEAGFRLAPGEALLIPPLRLHRYTGLARDPICWLFATFHLPRLDPQAVRPEPVALSGPAIRRLGRALDLWREAGATEDAGAELAVELGLLLRPFLPGAGGAAPAAAGGAGLLDRVQGWMQGRQAETYAIGELARGVGVSESHLRALFRQHFGLSLGRYVRESRCRMAALQLQAGRQTVTEVAASCGFRSVYSFSRTFKRVIGVNPGTLVRR